MFLPGIILIVVSVISAIFFLKSILHSDLSLTIPLLSLTPLFSSLFSLLFLNEKLLITQYFWNIKYSVRNIDFVYK